MARIRHPEMLKYTYGVNAGRNPMKSKITSKYQTTIPRKIRDKLNLSVSDSVEWKGEFFGTRQHGLPEFKIGDIINDYAILKLAREDAFGLVKEGHKSKNSKKRLLLKRIMERFKDKLDLINTG